MELLHIHNSDRAGAVQTGACFRVKEIADGKHLRFRNDTHDGGQVQPVHQRFSLHVYLILENRKPKGVVNEVIGYPVVRFLHLGGKLLTNRGPYASSDQSDRYIERRCSFANTGKKEP